VSLAVVPSGPVPADPELHAAALARFRALDGAMRAVEYRGWEFDDMLASNTVRRLTFGSLLLRRVAIQVGERSPVNVRPLVRVPKLQSTKANGFFARGYLRAFRATKERMWLERAQERLEVLLETRSPGPGLCWGNDFDFASRAGFFPRGVPTVVWTALIGEAFALARETTGEERYGGAVVGTGDFVLQGLPRHEEASGVCLGYTPELVPLVHNSNLLGAVTLLRAWRLDGDERKLRLAERSVAWSLSHQRSDGSWAYGVGAEYDWVDNFHTAYVIDCLGTARELAGDELVPESAIERSLRHWQRTFFLPDGTARYYADRTYPLDIQCAAQAIETLARRSAGDPASAELLRRVLPWTITTFCRADGTFDYRRGRFLRIPLVSLHWGQATMLSALGCVLEATPTGDPS
jgi:hypothetical protein